MDHTEHTPPVNGRGYGNGTVDPRSANACAGSRVKETLAVFRQDIVRDMFVQFFSEEGLSCRTAENSEHALSILADPQANIGVALLEHMLEMPLSGVLTPESHLEHTRWIIDRFREARPDLKIIVVSSFTEPDLIVSFMRMGACDFQKWPCNLVELIPKIRAALAV